MDRMERYKIEGSIKDVIAILDSAPMQPDMVPEVNLVQLTNRAPIAHLAIERGLKALIFDATGNREHGHALLNLFELLRNADSDASEFLLMAFQDAVKFFSLNTNAKEFSHLRTLQEYLARTGGERAFKVYRYWALGETFDRKEPIPPLILPVHREILCSLESRIGSSHDETVTERVEGRLRYAMFEGRHMMYASDDLERKESIERYLNWLFKEHRTRRSALEEAVLLEFNIADDAFIKQTLEAAHTELKQSKDPAVRYLIHRLLYLPKDSQPRNRDAVPDVNWLNDDQTFGEILTPASTPLGFVRRQADGGWGIEPYWSHATDIAETLADAKHYLVNRFTHSVDVIMNGTTKQLRIVGEGRHLFFSVSDAQWTPDCDKIDWEKEYELELWDNGHGLISGDQIVIKLRRYEFPGVVDILVGEVQSIDGHKVSIKGWNYTDLDKEP